MNSLGLLSPGLITGLGPAISIAELSAGPGGDAGPTMALIEPGALAAGSGPVVVVTNALAFADADDLFPPRFGENTSLWLNIIDYCMEWDDGSNQNTAPTTNAGGPYAGVTGNPVAFDGSSSSDNEDSNGSLIFDWTFGDGNSAAGEMVSHTYATAGTFTVTLTVTDQGGLTDMATVDAAITNGGGATTEQLVGALIDVVEDLDAPNLKNKDRNKLSSDLEKALEKIEDGHYDSAHDEMNTFINRVNELERRNKISPSQADQLRSAATEIIGQLNP